MKPAEWKYGLIVGAASLVWLLVSYFAGMRSSGLGGIQIATLVGNLVCIGGIVWAVGSVKKRIPEATFRELVKSGLVAAGVAAVVVSLGHLVYFLLIDPDFASRVAGYYRPMFEGMKMPEEQIEELLTRVRRDFGWKIGTLQAGLGTIVLGSIATVVVAAFLRRMDRKR